MSRYCPDATGTGTGTGTATVPGSRRHDAVMGVSVEFSTLTLPPGVVVGATTTVRDPQTCCALTSAGLPGGSQVPRYLYLTLLHYNASWPSSEPTEAAYSVASGAGPDALCPGSSVYREGWYARTFPLEVDDALTALAGHTVWTVPDCRQTPHGGTPSAGDCRADFRLDLAESSSDPSGSDAFTLSGQVGDDPVGTGAALSLAAESSGFSLSPVYMVFRTPDDLYAGHYVVTE